MFPSPVLPSHPNPTQTSAFSSPTSQPPKCPTFSNWATRAKCRQQCPPRAGPDSKCQEYRGLEFTWGISENRKRPLVPESPRHQALCAPKAAGQCKWHLFLPLLGSYETKALCVTASVCAKIPVLTHPLPLSLLTAQGPCAWRAHRKRVYPAGSPTARPLATRPRTWPRGAGVGDIHASVPSSGSGVGQKLWGPARAMPGTSTPKGVRRAPRPPSSPCAAPNFGSSGP